MIEKEIIIQQTKNKEYGYIIEANRSTIAIIPDHYVIWIYKIIHKKTKPEATKIIGLLTIPEFQDIAKRLKP